MIIKSLAVLLLVLPAGSTEDSQRGSTAAEQARGEASAAGLAEQEALLANGVTRGDYETGFARFKECVSEKGWTMSEPVLNPVDNQLYVWTTTPPGGYESTGEDPVEDCRNANVSLIEQALQGSTEQVMDPAILAGASTCLENRGYSLTGIEAKLVDFLPDGVDDRARLDAATDCVTITTTRLHPELPSVNMGFERDHRSRPGLLPAPVTDR